MVRNTTIDAYESLPRPAIVVGNEFPDGHRIAPHSHRRGQLLYGAAGVLMVTTEHGAWVVPPERAVWIPAGVRHELRMMGPASTNSLYIEPEALPSLPRICQVLGMSLLMRSLLQAAADLPIDYEPESRGALIMALMLQEIQVLPVLPLSLPQPRDARLAQHCRRFLAQPTPRDTIDHWSAALGMSRRAFTRFFKRETGLSFALWRQQACVFVALPRLAAGERVTTVALDLGYDSPAAFTSMFKRMLGAPPSRYFTAPP
ncbi:MAG TPA: helix-turn-helix transcriptional regulator [Alphaproteobacteria bacterium]|nr:helix-turn-helix transcriptional regulator [Alphaproteobacteria bacterium]